MAAEDLDASVEDPRLDDLVDLVLDYLARAQVTFPPFRSTLEAEAVLREEMDELTAAIRKGYQPQAPTLAGPPEHLEAAHVAAMAIRFMLDCSEPPLD